MKRQTLQIGGALLATTALSTAAAAGSFKTYASSTNVTNLTPITVSTQVFGSTGPENVSLGGALTGGQVNLDFSAALTNAFDVVINVSGAQFVQANTVNVDEYSESTVAGQTLNFEGSATGCAVQVLADRIELDDCLPNTGGTVDTLIISGLQFNEANGLATAGSSISLSGTVFNSDRTSTFETITSGAVVTSADSLETTVTAGSTLNLLNTTTPAFSTLSGGTAFGSLGNVKVSRTAAFGTDLSTQLGTSATNLTSFVEFTVTHGVLTDAATTNITVTPAGETAVAVTPTQFNGNIASFGFDSDSTVLGSFDITVNFTGSTTISAWSAGTIDVAFTAGTQAAGAPTSATGALAAISRSGMNVQINTAQSTAGNGSDLFQSLVRIVNNGSVSGAATIIVLNDATGTVLGTYTSASIAPGASLQVSVADIEAQTGITPSGQYGLSISGAFTGYAQHVMYNSVDNLFVDLSGFRIGSGENNP